jgi:hypothetical protein
MLPSFELRRNCPSGRSYPALVVVLSEPSHAYRRKATRNIHQLCLIGHAPLRSLVSYRSAGGLASTPPADCIVFQAMMPIWRDLSVCPTNDPAQQRRSAEAPQLGQAPVGRDWISWASQPYQKYRAVTMCSTQLERLTVVRRAEVDEILVGDPVCPRRPSLPLRGSITLCLVDLRGGRVRSSTAFCLPLVCSLAHIDYDF